MTPHMGSATYEGRLATGDKVIANIRMWADGHQAAGSGAGGVGLVTQSNLHMTWIMICSIKAMSGYDYQVK